MQGQNGIDGVNGINGVDGINGLNGATGIQGVPGQNGADGLNITNSYIQNDSLMITLSNGQNLNAGFLAGVSITNTVIQNDSLIVSLSNGQNINAGYLNCPGQNISLASITTLPATYITESSANIPILITDNGNEIILAAGVCFSTSPNPTFLDRNLKAMFLNDFNYNFGLYSPETNYLLPSTTYYARSFVTNVKGTTYGNEISFTTLAPCMPSGNYNCNVLISFNNFDYSIDYSNTISSILVVNSDLSISLNINDPLMPFDCTNFNLSGMINCNYDSFTLENNQNCSFNFGGSIEQNNTMFVAYNLDMYDSNGNYNGSIEIVIQ